MIHPFYVTILGFITWNGKHGGGGVDGRFASSAPSLYELLKWALMRSIVVDGVVNMRIGNGKRLLRARLNTDRHMMILKRRF